VNINLDFENAKIGSLSPPSDKASARSEFHGVKVDAFASFKGAVFAQTIDFEDANFATVDFTNAVWPQGSNHVLFEGMSFQRLMAAEHSEATWKQIKTVLSQNAYTPSFYESIGAMFRRSGNTKLADQVLIEEKRQERRTLWPRPAWMGSLLLDWLIGYGKRPWRAFIGCLVIVLVGCAIFAPDIMEPQKPEDTPRVYSRFWYSLDLLLPVIRLQAANVWKPKTTATAARIYLRFHVLLGWILIPIIVGSISGLIK